MKLLISLVTRSRPQQLIATVNRMMSCWRHPNTRMILQIDADDKATIDALAKPIWDDAKVSINIAPREDTIGGKINRSLSEPADLYMIGADDDPPITEGYDALYLEAAERFEDGIGMVYGHMANLSFSGVVAPTAKFVEKLGHIFPEYFPYWWVDHWTDDVAKIIGRISFADVRTDQSKAGKTQEMREPGWWATWFDAAYLMRRKIAHSIIMGDDFGAPHWLKANLLTHHPLIEERSRGVNECVRSQDRQYQQWSGLSTKDERYQRVKDRAIAMVPHLLRDYGMPAHEVAMFSRVLTPPSVVPGLAKAFA